MPIHLIASICLILYCVFYAANLRRARTAAILPAGCSGLAFSVEKSGWYSVWLHAPSAPAAAPPFALADTAGSRKNLLSALFHASFARSGGRETLLYYGRLKKGAYRFESGSAYPARFLIKKTVPEWPLAIPAAVILLPSAWWLLPLLPALFLLFRPKP